MNRLLPMLTLLTVVIVQATLGAQALPKLSLVLSISPFPSPVSCPSSVRQGSLVIEVGIEGLGTQDVAEIELLPDTLATATCLTKYGVMLPNLTIQNGNHRIIISAIPDGSYKLVVQAPPIYFREPQGYLFQVQQGQIIRALDRPLHFKLTPFMGRGLPPCRDLGIRPNSPRAADASLEPYPSCRAERIIDISGPPRPSLRESGRSPLSEGYHYVGPRTDQDNQGVWGRRYVVDPTVGHPGLSQHVVEYSQHVVEYSYANDSTYHRWMEAGWAEVAWRDDKQYVYEFDSATLEWHFFDQFTLSPGSAVETLVEYRPDTGTWWALYYLGDNLWALLAEEVLGFTVADHGYNWGEIYITGTTTHPVLPVSGFDKGYLKMTDGVWRLWDTRYATGVQMDFPYWCSMVIPYYQFSIHSPVVFLPVLVKSNDCRTARLHRGHD